MSAPEHISTIVDRVMTAKVTRPMMRYFGGKWRLAPWIISFFPEHRTYVEPYGGAGSVLLRKPPAPHVEVYNDIDRSVVDLFRCMRDPELSAKMLRTVALTPFAREEFKAASFEDVAADPVENARRLLVRTHFGFGACSISNRANGFRSVDRARGHSARCWATWPETADGITQRLRGVVVENLPAHEVIALHDKPTTLFYLDPPYPLATRHPRASYRGSWGRYRHEMSEAEHRALADQLHAIAGMAVISGYPSDLYDRELYAGWERHERGHTANGGKKVREVVWLNPACSAARSPAPAEGAQ